MCLGCYEEAGYPRIVTPETMRAAALVRKVYDHSAVGGNLHIVLDDWNLEDDNIEFCSQQIAAGGYEGLSSPDQLAIERECCDAFKALSKDARASALALWDGFLLPDGNLSDFVQAAQS